MSKVGKSEIRVDAFDKVTGRTKYYEDRMPAGALYARIKHSTIAHGFVKSIDKSAAEAIPGVVKVLTCEKVKKSEKLLKFTLNDGTGTPRQILSGIAKYYQPEELLGKTLVAVTNLPPRKMMGQESCGMLLSAERGDKLKLLLLDDSIPAGSRLV